MKHSPKAMTFPIMLALALAGGSAVAQSTDAKVTAEQIKSGMPAEVTKDGEQFMTEEKASQMQHRVNEQSPEHAKQQRNQHQAQQEKKAQHQHQYKEQAPGQHKNQSGSFSSFDEQGGSHSGGKGGKGSGGGGGGGRGH